ncbi:hypothetical protein OIV83_000192 [Microbotryomycetes sp. JL201]|nr:hypothetical protein OIV83_000192 [Microbotryomycetes sp. JL201]
MADAVPDGQPEPPPSYVAPSAWLTAPLEPRVPECGTSTNAQASAATAEIAFQHLHGRLGLPSSYFILRNKGTGRVLDLLGHKTGDGAAVRNYLDTQLSDAADEHWIDRAAPSQATRPETWLVAAESRQQPALVRVMGWSLALGIVIASSGLSRHDSLTWRDELDFIVEAVPRKRPSEDTGVWSTATKASKDAFDEVGGLFGGIGDRLGGMHLFGRSAVGSPRLDVEMPGPPPPPKPRSPNPQSQGGSTFEETISSQKGTGGSSSSTLNVRNSPLPAMPSDPVEDVGSDSDSDPSAFRPVRIVRLRRSAWREKFPSEVLSRSNAPALRLAPTESKELRRWRRRQWEIVPVAVRDEPLADGLGAGLGIGVDSFLRRAGVDRALPQSPPTADSLDAMGMRRWSASAAATSLASSAGGVAATASELVSTFGGSIARPILASVRSSGLHIVTGRNHIGNRDLTRRASDNEQDGDDDDDPRWFSLDDGDGGRATPSGASWDDATSLPDDELRDFLASSGKRRRSAGGSSGAERESSREPVAEPAQEASSAPPG